MELGPISDKMINARINSKHCKHIVILCYAPTNKSDNEDKEDCYDKLQQAVAKVR